MAGERENKDGKLEYDREKADERKQSAQSITINGNNNNNNNNLPSISSKGNS